MVRGRGSLVSQNFLDISQRGGLFGPGWRQCGGETLVTVIGIFSLFGLAFFLKVDGAKEKVLFLVIGALSSIATTVVTYYFGSSEGSARKNEIFQGMKDKF